VNEVGALGVELGERVGADTGVRRYCSYPSRIVSISETIRDRTES
jgi:hypothetical protein